MKTVRIAAAQTPEYRGDIEAALAYAVDLTAQAAANGVRLICFPECYLQGYLLNRSDAQRFALDLASAEFNSIVRRFPNSGMIVAMGMIEWDRGRLFNTAVLIQNRSVIGHYRKAHLLGGESIFEAGTDACLFAVDGLRFGINICYDTNFPQAAREIADLGGTLIVCLANNMLPGPKAEEFRDLHNAVRGERCRETGLWLISSDVTGERDGCVAWGPTAVLNPVGHIMAQLPLQRPGLLIFDMPVGSVR